MPQDQIICAWSKVHSGHSPKTWEWHDEDCLGCTQQTTEMEEVKDDYVQLQGRLKDDYKDDFKDDRYCFFSFSFLSFAADSPSLPSFIFHLSFLLYLLYRGRLLLRPFAAAAVRCCGGSFCLFLYFSQTLNIKQSTIIRNNKL